MTSKILVTGMSGTGKSSALRVLGERGHRVVDTDADEWCRWVTGPDGSADWIWREEAMTALLDGPAEGALFVAGGKTNQGAFSPAFDHVVLSAPASDRRHGSPRRGRPRTGVPRPRLTLISVAPGGVPGQDGRMPPSRLHADQVDIDESVARRLVASQLPKYARLPLHRVPSGGTENAVFRLGSALALRMPLTAGAVAGLLAEVRWLPVVGPRVALEVPEVVATGTPEEGYPFPWAVLTWLPGQDALSGRFRSLPDTAAVLGDFVAELRSLDPAEGPVGGRGGPLTRRDTEFRSALSQCDGLLDVDAAAAVWDDALAAPPWAGPPVWLHADLIPGNLLVRDGRLVGILDFGTVTTGDPAYDVTAAWHILDAASRPAFLSRLGVDEPTRRRARGLVLSGGVIALPYYLHTNPAMVTTARTGIDAVLSAP